MNANSSEPERLMTKPYNYSDLIENTNEITFALNSLILYLEIHEIAHREYISDYTLLIIETLSLILGFIIYTVLLPPEFRSLKPVFTGLLLLGILYTLCPVLATINKNYANDTIYLI